MPEGPDPRSDSVKPLALNYSRLGIMVPRRSRKANLCPKICASIPKTNFCWDEKFSLNDQNFYENRPSFIEVPRISHFRRKYRLHQKTCENKCKITLISVDILWKKWILNNFCENIQRHLCLEFPNYVLKLPHPRFNKGFNEVSQESRLVPLLSKRTLLLLLAGENNHCMYSSQQRLSDGRAVVA